MTYTVLVTHNTGGADMVTILEMTGEALVVAVALEALAEQIRTREEEGQAR